MLETTRLLSMAPPPEALDLRGSDSGICVHNQREEGSIVKATSQKAKRKKKKADESNPVTAQFVSGTKL